MFAQLQAVKVLLAAWHGHRLACRCAGPGCGTSWGNLPCNCLLRCRSCLPMHTSYLLLNVVTSVDNGLTGVSLSELRAMSLDRLARVGAVRGGGDGCGMPVRSNWAEVYITVFARAVSAAGDLLAAVAIILVLQQRGSGGFAVAAVLIVAAVPPVLLVRWTGRLVDRADSRVLLVVTGLIQAGVCLALTATSNVVGIIALLAVLAAGLAVTQPCMSALLPAMVVPDDLPRASSIGQTAVSLGMMVAPAISGVLTGRFGVRVPLVADAGSYIAIVCIGLAIRTRRGGQGSAPAHTAAAPVPNWKLRDDSLLRSAILLTATVVAAASLVNVAEVFLIRAVLHSSASAYGLIGSLWLAAVIAGSWLFAHGGQTDARMARRLQYALMLTCLGITLMAFVPAIIWLVPASMIGGLGNGGVNVSASVLLARRAPPDLRGRVFAVFVAITNATSTVGYLVGGVLVIVISVRATIASAGILGIILVIALARPVAHAEHSAPDGQNVGLVPGPLPDHEAAADHGSDAIPEKLSHHTFPFDMD